MKIRFGKLLWNLILIINFIAATVVIFFALKPFFSWYLAKIPVLGVDLYYSATYVAYHLKHFSFSFNSFKDVWFGGYPLFDDFPQLHFYLMTPFSMYLGLIMGIQVYVLVSLFLFISFSCLLFYQLCKNIGFALLLAILIFLSPNIYGAAIWGGSLPYFATQAYLPFTIFLMVRYLSSGNRRWFYIASLVCGIFISGHPMPMVTFAFPAIVILLLFWNGKEFNYKVISRIKDLFLFFLLNVLISLSIFFRPLINMVMALLEGKFLAPLDLVKAGPYAAQSASASKIATDISNFYKSQVDILKTDTNILLFYLAGLGFIVFLIAFAISKNRLNRLGRVLPFAIFVFFVTAHVYLNAYGYSLLSQGWYRAFWVFPLAIGALCAVLWGEFFESQETIFTKLKPHITKKLFFVFGYAVAAAFIFVGFTVYHPDLIKLQAQNDKKLEYSSAFPEALSIKVSKSEQDKLKKELLPSFIDPNDKNKRLYEAEAGVNIWWNALFDMPLARGYIDPPIASSQRGGLFWLDIAIANDSLVRDFKVDENVAFNNALFLIDWNGIYDFEGGRLSSKGSNVGPSSYLVKNNVFDKTEKTTTHGAVVKWETTSGKPELRLDLPQVLNYYHVNEKFTSPVLYPSDAPAIVFFGDLPSYEDFLRVIATYNINSRKLIPVYGGKYIDDFSSKDLLNFDAAIIANYDYKNKGKAFGNLYKYVNSGGKIFIDTGSEVKESEAGNLPDIFPMKKSIRHGVGKEWQLESSSSNLLNSVVLKNFGPLIFNGSEWNLSFPEGDLRGGSEAILRDKGRPILVKRQIGKGEVVWSGANLTYHYNQYKVVDEAKLLTNIIQEFVKIEDKPLIPSNAIWIKPEQVKMETNKKVRGILFKEEGYKGWSARLVSDNNKKLPIYLAGPTYPGFMYVPIGNTSREPISVQFKFSGDFTSKIVSLISLITVLYLLEKITFPGIISGKTLDVLRKSFKKRIMFWWEKEDE